jgi:SpoVK/Ycf46/Vps4 family AAA+-type ATPase
MIPREPLSSHPAPHIEHHFLVLVAQLTRIDQRLQQRLVHLQEEALALAERSQTDSFVSPPDWLLERQQWIPPEPLDEASTGSHLAQLVRSFSLNPLERDLLLLALMPCLDRRYHSLFAQAQGQSRLIFPTRQFAMDILCPEPCMQAQHMASLLPGSALLRHGLLKLEGGADGYNNSMLKPEPSIYPFLIGHQELPAALAPYIHWQEPPRLLSASTLHCIDQLARALDATAPVRIVLSGLPGSSQALVMAQAAQQRTMRVLLVDLDNLPDDANQTMTILNAVCREARLRNACLALQHLSAWSRKHPHLFVQWQHDLQDFCQPLITLQDAGTAICWLGEQPQVIVEMPPRSLHQDQQLLQQYLHSNDIPLGTDIDLSALVQRFPIVAERLPPTLQEAELYRQLRDTHSPLSQEDLHRAFRWRSQQNFGELAQRIEPVRSFIDLIAPPELEQQLRELLAAIEQRDYALSKGFSYQELGINALFHGTSGAGKTMAAEVLANALGVDLIKVDLSTVVNKYIGETEKNLSTIFDLAAMDSGLLFFDEADALFGKRSDSKDAKDRHANIEVAYLLQRIESHPGLVILSTNNRSHLDQAFTRRFTFMIKFGFPDAATRLRLWHVIWPPAVHLAADVDFERLATQAEITGANIRNIARLACWLAASEGEECIGMTHIQHALKRELNKTGQVAFL